MTADMGGRITAGAATGAFSRAASVQAVMAPSMKGSGRFSHLNSRPPARPIAMASANRR